MVLNRVDGLAVDTITNVWATVTGWFDAYAWGATLALLLRLVISTYSRAADQREPDVPRHWATMLLEGRQMNAGVSLSRLVSSAIARSS